MQEQRTTAALPSLAPKSVAKVCVCVSRSLLSYFYLKTNGPNSSSYSLLLSFLRPIFEAWEPGRPIPSFAPPRLV